MPDSAPAADHNLGQMPDHDHDDTLVPERDHDHDDTLVPERDHDNDLAQEPGLGQAPDPDLDLVPDTS